ncbi:uncharacterized protein LOC134781617 [Penaeus indicus]|uniref:uncharacterized protein LOC134781617 n=1 Tax=Penaeus indicus TaxID=29960 RepID=UPI00300C655B
MNPLPDSSDINSSSQNASPHAPRSVFVEQVSLPSVPEQGPRATEPLQNGFVQNLITRTSEVLPEEHVNTPTACDSTDLDFNLVASWPDEDIVNEDFETLLNRALHRPPQQ